MAMTFDATLNMGRECPEGFLAAFDRVPTAPVSALNVDLATVTAAADIVYGLKKLITDALLLTRLRVKRDVATRIFRGVRMMEESDTFLMIVDAGKEKQAKRAILLVGEKRLGSADESIKTELDNISDLERLDRMIRRTAKATTWREILDTP